MRRKAPGCSHLTIPPHSPSLQCSGGEEPMKVDATTPAIVEATASSTGVIDFGFYGTFWGLQQAFADPASSVAKHAWPCLVERLQTVLQVFDASVPHVH